MCAGCLDGDVAAADGGKQTAVCRRLDGSTQQSADALMEAHSSLQMP